VAFAVCLQFRGQQSAPGLQRELLADILRNDGFEVVECTTAEAAELVISSAGTDLQALVTDHNLAGVMTGAELAATPVASIRISTSS
jgi:CheY-like chemotaxis protein